MSDEIKRLKTELNRSRRKENIYRICIIKIRLEDLENIMSQARVVIPKKKNIAGIGSRVKIEFNVIENRCRGDSGKHITPKSSVYEIGSYIVFGKNPNRISYDSRIGRMLNGATLGESFRINSHNRCTKETIRVIEIS